MRATRFVYIVAVQLAALALVAATALAASASALPVPPSFKLRGSNGYSVVVIASAAHSGSPDQVLVAVARRDGGVLYLAPAAVTESSIQADLGSLGAIDVTFQATGQGRSEHAACNKPGDGFKFDSGSYVGSIELHGEEGFTEVSASQAKGDVQFLLGLACLGSGGVTGSGPNLPGAELAVRSSGAPGVAAFTVHKNHPGDRAYLEAGVDEAQGKVKISRFVSSSAPASAFRWDPGLATARVKPPAPFSGSGVFRRAAKSSRRWTGSLTVDFPGRADVPLTGPGRRARLVRAVWDVSN